jgi:hypothetical protein
MLRKGGRRVEVLVGIAEKEIRGWLEGEGLLGGAYGGWKVLDGTVVEAIEGAGVSTSPSGPSRRLPAQHQVTALPSLPQPLPAVLELSRSPAHLTWTVAESFDRLVLHLLVRYYELISWSECPHPLVFSWLHQSQSESKHANTIRRNAGRCKRG